MTDLNNRSLDLTGILAHIHRQATLYGGPYNEERAPLPVQNEACYPKFLCQPGRGGDLTWYHYARAYGNTYVYQDHCYAVSPHQPPVNDQEEYEEVDNSAGVIVRATTIAALLGTSAMIMGTIIGLTVRAAIRWFG